MTTQGNEPKYDEPIREEDEPLYNDIGDLGSASPNRIRKITSPEKALQRYFDFLMNSRRLLSAYTLLFVCIGLTFLMYIIEIFAFHNDSLSEQVFDLFKTVIITSIGYVLGRGHGTNSGDG